MDKNKNTKDNHDGRHDKDQLHTPARDEQRKKDEKWNVQDEFNEPDDDERIKMESKISNAPKQNEDDEAH